RPPAVPGWFKIWARVNFRPTQTSALGLPALEFGLRVDRHAVNVDLDVELAADRARVAGLADLADPLPRPDPLALVDARRVLHVRVHIGPVFFGAVDQQVVAVEDRVVADFPPLAGHRADQFGPTGGEDVEAFVDPPAIARCAKFTDRPAFSVRP